MFRPLQFFLERPNIGLAEWISTIFPEEVVEILDLDVEKEGLMMAHVTPSTGFGTRFLHMLSYIGFFSDCSVLTSLFDLCRFGIIL